VPPAQHSVLACPAAVRPAAAYPHLVPQAALKARSEPAELPRAECPMRVALALRPQVVAGSAVAEFESAAQRWAARPTEATVVWRLRPAE
jgi:hypothetical protein